VSVHSSDLILIILILVLPVLASLTRAALALLAVVSTHRTTARVAREQRLMAQQSLPPGGELSHTDGDGRTLTIRTASPPPAVLEQVVSE
jgi:hypothetical protein